MGYTKVRHYHGGIADWKEAGLPIESAPAIGQPLLPAEPQSFSQSMPAGARRARPQHPTRLAQPAVGKFAARFDRKPVARADFFRLARDGRAVRITLLADRLFAPSGTGRQRPTDRGNFPGAAERALLQLRHHDLGRLRRRVAARAGTDPFDLRGGHRPAHLRRAGRKVRLAPPGRAGARHLQCHLRGPA